MNPVLSFVNQHWIPCLHVNRHLGEDAVYFYKCRNRTKFSYFFVPGYIGDLYRIDFNRHHNQFTRCYHNILDELKPSRMFVVDIYDHVFTILYLSDVEIYYIDYYRETGREEYFRIELMTLDTIKAYIRALQNLDFRAITEFNHFNDPEGSAARLASQYWSSFERLSLPEHERWPCFNWIVGDKSYISNAYYHEITYTPTMADIIRVAHESREALRPYTDPEVTAAIAADIAYLETEVAKVT